MLAKIKSIFSAEPRRPLTKISGYSLYYFPTCPFCVNVRRAAVVIGVELELRNIINSTKYASELMAGGGRRTVPCLRIESENGVEWMYESEDIIEHLKSKISDC